jgi:hypothetical protein
MAVGAQARKHHPHKGKQSRAKRTTWQPKKREREREREREQEREKTNVFHLSVKAKHHRFSSSFFLLPSQPQLPYQVREDTYETPVTVRQREIERKRGKKGLKL